MPNTTIAGLSIPRQFRASMSPEALEGVVAGVWKRQLGLTLHRLRGHVPTNFSVSASVPLVGAGTAIAVLTAPFDVAASAAVGMLGLQRAEVAPGDVDDVFGELVTAIGEGVRILLAGPSALGTAWIVRGNGLTSAVPGSPIIGEVALHSGAGPLHVGVWGRWPATLPGVS